MSWLFAPAPPVAVPAPGGDYPVRRLFCVGRNYAEHIAEGDRAAYEEILKTRAKALTEPEVHRGGGSEIATVYWPQRDVTLDGLQTFRIDVGEEYEDNGKLEFRKGTKVLYSQPFEPEGTVTVAAIPQSVIDALKSGSTVKWGIFFDKKNNTATTRHIIIFSQQRRLLVVVVVFIHILLPINNNDETQQRRRRR